MRASLSLTFLLAHHGSEDGVLLEIIIFELRTLESGLFPIPLVVPVQILPVVAEDARWT